MGHRERLRSRGVRANAPDNGIGLAKEKKRRPVKVSIRLESSDAAALWSFSVSSDAAPSAQGSALNALAKSK
jgi:hypothetical protein